MSREKSEERRCHYHREVGHFVRGHQKKRWDQVKQREQNAQVQQIAVVAQANLSDSWPGTMSEGKDDKVDMIEAYGWVYEVCEGENEEDW